MIPKVRGNLTQLSKAKIEDSAILGKLVYKATEIAKGLDLENGYRLVINNGPDAGILKRSTGVSLTYSYYRRQEIRRQINLFYYIFIV